MAGGDVVDGMVLLPSPGCCGRCGLLLGDVHRIANRRLLEPDYDGVHSVEECDAERARIEELADEGRRRSGRPAWAREF
jgi:hypothetical protein